MTTSEAPKTSPESMLVGILALQGAVAEHLHHLQEAAQSPDLAPYKLEFRPVATAAELEACLALVIPGGESTTMLLIAQRTGMLQPLVEFAQNRPVWGTCAGLIFLALEIRNARPHQKALGGLAVAVTRNAFGRQAESFETTCDFSAFGAPASFETVFIRAPVVSAVLLEQDKLEKEFPDPAHESQLAVTVTATCTNKAPVEILHRLPSGLVVAVRQGHILGTSFHPELSPDSSFHGWFLREFVVKLT